MKFLNKKTLQIAAAVALLLPIFNTKITAQTNFQISGNIHRHSGSPVPDVRVKMSGNLVENDTTDAAGNYFFPAVPFNASVILTPAKDTLPSECLSVRDLILMQKHVLGFQLLPTPYQILAGDVNQSNSLTTFDISQTRNQILGSSKKFPNAPSWRFVREKHVFQNPLNPFSPQPPAIDSVLGLLSDFNSNFIGIKIGDASDCSDDGHGKAFLSAKIANKTAVVGQNVAVEVSVEGFANVAGLQFSMAWDTSIAKFKNLTNFNLAGLGNQNFNENDAVAGKISLCWHDANGSTASLPNGTNIFQIIFEAKKSGSTPLNFSPLPTISEVVAANDSAYNLNEINGLLTVLAPPTITCPPNLTVSTDAGQCTASIVQIGNPTVQQTAGCGTFSIVSTAPSIFPKGETIVVFTVVDDCGIATCSMTVTVVDNEAPLLICPSDLVLTASVPNCNGVAAFQPPQVFENCPPLGASLTSNIAPGSLLGVGQHDVIYSYSNTFGETAACSFQITVLSNGDSTFLNPQICAGETVTVGGQIFNQSGNYNVLLKNLIGCDSLVFLNLTVNPLPQFSISGPATICPNDPDSLRIFGNFSKIDWSGPSGFAASGGQILVSEPGVYIATVTNSSGCTAIATKILTLYCGSVLADFSTSADTFCTDFGVNFLDKSVGTMTSWLWDFGNGTFSSLQNPPTIFYPSAGEYTVRLTVADGVLQSLFSKKILVYVKPQVNFQTSIPDLCDPLTLKFDATAQAVFPIKSWSWNFGDGAWGATQSATHTFLNYDTVQTSLWTIDRFGCTDSLDFDVAVVPNGIAPLPVLLSPVLCKGEKLAVGSTIFDENNLSGKVILPSFHGCDSVVEVKLSYLPEGKIFLGNDTTVCENQQVTLDAGAGGAFKWSNGATTQKITVATAGIFSVTISGSSGNCAATGEIKILQDKIPNLQADAGGDQTVCQTMQFVRLDGKKPPVGTGAWSSVGTAAVDNPANPQSFVFDLKIGKNLFVWTLSNGTCRNFDSDTAAVEVFPLVAEQPMAGADIAFCESDILKLNAAPPVAAGLTGFWTQAAGQNLIFANLNDPKTAVSGLNSTSIYLLFWNLTNGVCPPRTDDLLISRSPKVLPTANAGDNQVLCTATSTTLKGNLPPGTTGKWTAAGDPGDAVIGKENDPMTPILNISPGTLRMVWTLSSEGCGGFSSDTVVIFQSGGLQALSDGFKDKEQPLTGLNVLGNDSIGLLDNIILPLPFSQPSLGTVAANVDGTFDFTFGSDTARTTFFTYRVCLKSCPDICSEAEVEIYSEGPLPALIRPPNVMTPNGDGVADFFEIPNFRELKAPIYLTVVNRWGDVVYFVEQPDTYLNDWAGTDIYGNPLPVGTYFFVFRGGGGDGEETGFVMILR